MLGGTASVEPDEYYPSILGGEKEGQDIPVAANFESSSRVTLMMLRIKSTSTVEIGEEFGKWRLNEIIKLNGKPVAVLERNLKKHGLFVFTSIDGIVASFKKPIGIVRSRQINRIPKYLSERQLKSGAW
jgi:hypothetical protein